MPPDGPRLYTQTCTRKDLEVGGYGADFITCGGGWWMDGERVANWPLCVAGWPGGKYKRSNLNNYAHKM